MVFYLVKKLTCTSCNLYNMGKLVFLHLLFIKFVLTSDSSDDILETLNLLPSSLRTHKGTDVNEDFCFHVLRNYQMNAAPANESTYRWVARVVHSRSANVPHVCTAICIDKAIFITAAACIYSLKIKYTTVIYMSKRFEVRAFVLPSKPTKQMFDDIGIIVVDTKKVKGVTWAPIRLFNALNRTDDKFLWLAKLNATYGQINYKVVGYAMEKGVHKIPTAESEFNLYQLDVLIEPDICFNVLNDLRVTQLKGFHVPCYYTCNFKDYLNMAKPKKKINCQNRYLGVEGGAVIHTVSNKLIGVATWSGGDYFRWELPVGFAFANSETFYKDLACAKWIRDDNGPLDKKGYYQSLCDGKQ